MAVTGQAARLPEVMARSLLRAELEDPLILVDLATEDPALLHGQTQRLLAIDVLLVPHCSQGSQDVPVVGRGDVAGVDVRPTGDLLKVVDRGAVLVLVLVVDAVLCLVEHVDLDVADRHHLAVLPLEIVGHDALALRADADEPHDHPVARRHCAIRAYGR